MESIDSLWTQTLVQELVAQGVTYFCLSPGSRSTPLVLALSKHPCAETFIHFDERAMAFHALGYAKASNKPVAIIVTSGTAAGNLLPALMEAHESHTPLIVLTADRPYELQECGANQTTHQLHMFQNYVRWQHAFPTPDPSCPLDYIKTTIAHAILKATGAFPGPVHLNCPFREPFSLSSTPLQELPELTAKTSLYSSQHVLAEEQLLTLASLLQNSTRGLILVGAQAFNAVETQYLYALAEVLRWPILCDPLSEGRAHTDVMARYEVITHLLEATAPSWKHLEPECVLHFEGAFVSKRLMSFLKRSPLKAYIHVSRYEKRQDPAHLLSHRLQISPTKCCEQLIQVLKKNPPHPYLQAWKDLDAVAQEICEDLFRTQPSLSEPQLFHELARYDFSQHVLFVGNSMPIRSLLQFFHPEKPPQQIYGQRGLSGIDGNIATAIGIAKATSSPLIAFLGDQTVLHDLTSFSQLKTVNTPTLFIVINNGGGNIFAWLPIYENQAVCEAYFINPHAWDFAPVAKMFGLAYHKCLSLEETVEHVEVFLNSSRHALLEVKTERDADLAFYHTLKQKLHENALLSANR